MSEPPPPVRPAQRTWRVRILTATWLSYAGYYFCRKAFGIVKAPIKAQLGVDDYALAHIFTAYLVAYMLGQFLAGWWGTKVAARRLLLTGMAITAACNVAFGFAHGMGPAGYWAFFGFMIANGFAQATGWPGNVGTIAQWFRRGERGTVMGFWSTCYQLGSIAAKAFAAFMVGWAGVAWSFWGASLVMVGVWITFYVLQRDQPEDVGLPAVVEPAPPPVAGEPAPTTHDGWAPGALRTVVVMGLAYFSFKFLRYGLDSWAPLVIEERFATSTSTAGYVSTVFDWVGFTGVVFAGWASDRFFGGRRSPVAFAMALGMVASAAFLWAVGLNSVTAFAVGIGLVGFTLFGPDSLLVGVGAIDVGNRKRAVMAAGIVNGIGSAGPALQEELIGYLKAYHGLDAVLGLLVGVAALGAAVTGLLWAWGRRGRSAF